MLNELLPRVAKCALSTMDKRHKFVVEESNFFNSSFLEKKALSNALILQECLRLWAWLMPQITYCNVKA